MSIPKLQTLPEDLETVSIDDIPARSSLKKQSSVSSIGLGIHIPPKRPSDSIRQKTNPKLSLMERPVSNDSITTTFSEFSENNNNNSSRNSSITSESTTNSPILKNPKYKTPMSSTYELNNLSISSLSTIKLTPSQRLKLKRKNSFLNLKEKENYFEKHYEDDESIVDSSFDDTLIWNVPFTSTFFSPVSGKSSKMLKSVIDTSPIQMPISPLPGNVSLPSSPAVKMYRNPNEAQSLSRFYELSSSNYSKNELIKRQQSMSNLPIIAKNANDLGLDDMQLYSKEKIQTISSTRQIWLPPKSSEECKKHEHDLIKMFESSAKIDKLKKERYENLIELEKKNVVRWNELNSRGLLRNSSILEIKKLVFKCSIPDYLKYEVWNNFLKNDINKKKINNELLNNFEKFESLIKEFNNIPNLPNDKIEYLNKLIADIKNDHLNYFKNLKDEKLLELLKLRLISKLGLDSNIDLKLMSILLLKFNLIDTYNLTNLLKLNIFNNEIIIKKFNDNLFKNHVLKKYLNHKEYLNDLQQLSFNKILSIILKLSINKNSEISNNQLIFQIFDIFTINNDYKIFYSLIITILRHYHFGFTDIDDLLNNKERQVTVVDKFQFFEKLNHYYKKF